MSKRSETKPSRRGEVGAGSGVVVSRPVLSVGSPSSARPSTQRAAPRAVPAARPPRPVPDRLNALPPKSLSGTSVGRNNRGPVKAPLSTPPVNSPISSSSRASALRLEVPKLQVSSSPKRASPTREKARETMTCKARPESNKKTGGSGGRGFIPWCK